MKKLLLICGLGLLTALFARPHAALADGVCVVNQTPYNPQNLLYFYPLCTPAGALQVAIVSGGGTGGGASGTPGSSGSTAQYVQGVPGGYPVAVTGTFTSTTTFPYNATQSQTASTASFLGAVGAYYTTAPTLTNGQVNPLSVDQNGYLNVDVKVGGGGGGGSTTFPFTMNTASPQAGQTAAAIGVVGLVQGTTTVQPLQIDPTTGALLTKSAASVNGTYGAPNTTVSPAATSVQYEQGVGPNGQFVVNTPAPCTTATCSTTVNTPPPTTAVALNSGTNTIGSIANTAFGITGSLPAGTNNIGSVTAAQPYSASAGPQTATANSAVAAGCIYNSASPAPTSGQFLPLQCSPTGGLLVSGSFTATTSFPYNMGTPQPQAAQANSAMGIVGVYNSTAPAPTTGQVVPLQLDSAANLDVNVKAGSVTATSTYPYNATQQAATTASFVGSAGQYNSTPPTLTNGQIAGLQLNSSGALLVAGTFSATTTFPYSNANAQTGTSASFLGMACAYNGTTAPTLASGSVNPLLCNSVGDQLVALDTTTGLGSSTTTPTIGRIQGGSNTSLVYANGGSGALSTASVGLETLSQPFSYVPGTGNGNYQALISDYKTGATPYGAVANPGGSLVTAITTAATTTCTAIETNTDGRIASVINAASTAQTITLSLYDEGASPTCAAADLRYSVVLGASQIVTLNIPVTAGIAYQVSAAPSANVIVTRN